MPIISTFTFLSLRCPEQFSGTSLKTHYYLFLPIRVVVGNEVIMPSRGKIQIKIVLKLWVRVWRVEPWVAASVMAVRATKEMEKTGKGGNVRTQSLI